MNTNSRVPVLAANQNSGAITESLAAANAYLLLTLSGTDEEEGFDVAEDGLQAPAYGEALRFRGPGRFRCRGNRRGPALFARPLQLELVYPGERPRLEPAAAQVRRELGGEPVQRQHAARLQIG